MGLFDLYSSTVPEHTRHDIDIALVPAARSSPATPLTTTTSRPVDLPLELVFDIIELAALAPATEPDRATLRACALVSRTWRAPAQSLLYRNFVLRDATTAQVFATTLKARPALADAVRTLRATVDRNQPDGLSPRTFAQVVSRCSRLETVHLALFGSATVASNAEDRGNEENSMFDADTLALLAAGPKVTSLHLANWSSDKCVLFDLLEAWPCAPRALSLAGVPPSLPIRAPPQCVIALEALRINCTGPLAPDFAEWLLRDARLRALDIARTWEGEALRLLEAQGSALEALALPALHEHELVGAVRDGCPALRSLTVAGACLAPAFWYGEASQLEHLAVGQSHGTNLGAVLRAVHGGKLRTLTLRSTPDGVRHPQLAPIRVACTMYGVDFNITSDVRRFKALTADVFSASAASDMFAQLAAC
ncbi:hypothetical protein HDZ31DRAFT_59499 [Schizophyllum fasciatum]